RRHVELRLIHIGFRRQVPNFHRLRLGIELHERALVHVPEPELAALVGTYGERAGREAGLLQRNWIFLVRARLDVDAPDELLAEARVPGIPLVIDDDIVRLDRFARQVVLGIDDAGGAAGRSRERLELVGPLAGLARAEIDLGQIFADRPVDLDAA